MDTFLQSNNFFKKGFFSFVFMEKMIKQMQRFYILCLLLIVKSILHGTFIANK